MTSTSSPWQKPSRFKEHLSISPSDDFGIEQSRFSPDSPPAHLLRATSLTLAGTPQSLKTVRDIPEDVESLRSYRSSNWGRQTIRDRFTKIFFDVRTLDDRTNDNDIDLVSVRPLSPWAPLKLDKKEKHLPTIRPLPPKRKQKQKKRFRWCMLLLILIILALLGDITFLNVRVVELTKITNGKAPPSPTPTSTPSNSSSNAVEGCLTQFAINAPSDPSAYPCSTCLPILSNVANNSNATSAVQFCGLRAILESTSTTGQTALSNGGWGKDLGICAWSGVSCSASDSVTSLQLTFPAVPALIPTEISALLQLQSLQVIGDGNSPAGVLPDSFRNLTSLTTLHLESTAITTVPNNLFSLLTKVTDLALISNGQFSGNLTSITSLPLQSLVIKNQRLANPIGSLAGSKTLQSSLVVLDLSSNSLSGSIPASISSLGALTQLHLDNNNLSQAVPSAFPSSLQSLTISNNTNLSGTMPSGVCSSTSLKECNLKGTSVNHTATCGVCQF